MQNVRSNLCTWINNTQDYVATSYISSNNFQHYWSPVVHEYYQYSISGTVPSLMTKYNLNTKYILYKNLPNKGWSFDIINTFVPSIVLSNGTYSIGNITANCDYFYTSFFNGVSYTIWKVISNNSSTIKFTSTYNDPDLNTTVPIVSTYTKKSGIIKYEKTPYMVLVSKDLLLGVASFYIAYGENRFDVVLNKNDPNKLIVTPFGNIYWKTNGKVITVYFTTGRNSPTTNDLMGTITMV